ELGRELDVGKPGEPVGGEEPALPGACPDDRLVDDRARLDLLVGPDLDVGVDRRAGADDHLVADDAPLLEQTRVLDPDGAADDRATEAAVLADVNVVPDDRVGDLGAGVD